MASMRQGVAPFVNRSERYGLSRGGWCWDSKFADFVNDASAELVQTTGFMKGSVDRWPELHEMALANTEGHAYHLLAAFSWPAP